MCIASTLNNFCSVWKHLRKLFEIIGWGAVISSYLHFRLLPLCCRSSVLLNGTAMRGLPSTHRFGCDVYAVMHGVCVCWGCCLRWFALVWGIFMVIAMLFVPKIWFIFIMVPGYHHHSTKNWRDKHIKYRHKIDARVLFDRETTS